MFAVRLVTQRSQSWLFDRYACARTCAIGIFFFRSGSGASPASHFAGTSPQGDDSSLWSAPGSQVGQYGQGEQYSYAERNHHAHHHHHQHHSQQQKQQQQQEVGGYADTSMSSGSVEEWSQHSAVTMTNTSSSSKGANPHWDPVMTLYLGPTGAI